MNQNKPQTQTPRPSTQPPPQVVVREHVEPLKPWPTPPPRKQ